MGGAARGQGQSLPSFSEEKIIDEKSSIDFRLDPNVSMTDYGIVGSIRPRKFHR
jgi:hypothetical protein